MNEKDCLGKKNTIKEASDNDELTYYAYTIYRIDADTTHWSKNFTYLERSYTFELDRKVSAEDIENMDLRLMPGFRLTWKYSKDFEPEAKYHYYGNTEQFVR